jgi:hypothetical protein
MSQQEKQRIELIGLYHFAEELALHGFIPLLTTRNIRGIDMVVSNINGSKSATFQVKTIQLWNEKNESFPVYSAPSDDSKTHIKDADDLFRRIQDTIYPSPNKWWAFVPVEDSRVIRYYVCPSGWVHQTAREKAIEYLKLDDHGKITKISQGGKSRGKLLTWGSLGVIGFYVNDVRGFENAIEPVKKALE